MPALSGVVKPEAKKKQKTAISHSDFSHFKLRKWLWRV
jgi:hypothetical protein